jgi:hypothetical protein
LWWMRMRAWRGGWERTWWKEGSDREEIRHIEVGIDGILYA